MRLFHLRDFPLEPSIVPLLRVILPHDVGNAVNELTTDHDSGARQLALKALNVLRLAAAAFPLEQASWTEIVNCAWYIIQARPSMKAAIETTILRTLHDLQSVYPPPRTSDIIKRQIADETTALEQLSKHFTEYILSLKRSKIRILTLSYSSTIVSGL